VTIARRLDNIESRLSQSARNCGPAAPKKRFDAESLKPYLRAHYIIHCRPKLNTPRERVREFVGGLVRGFIQTARTVEWMNANDEHREPVFVQRTPEQVAEMTDRMTDEFMAVADDDWREMHRVVWHGIRPTD
jgi:hypothetical protein